VDAAEGIGLAFQKIRLRPLLGIKGQGGHARPLMKEGRQQPCKLLCKSRFVAWKARKQPGG